MNLLTNMALTTLKKLKCEIINSLNDDKSIFSVFYNLISRELKAFLNFFYSWAQNYYKVFLLLIIIIGFFIRFPYIKSGLPYLNNSDEVHIAGRAIKILQTGDFNPHWFNYPSLTINLVLPFYVLNYFRLMGNGRLTALEDITIGWETLAHGSINYPSFYAVGRLVIALIAILSIFLIYEVGKRYFNKKVGLISALILIFFPFHIRWSTIIRPDMIVTFFVLLSLFFLSLYIEKGRVKFIILAGLSAGLTTSTKYNSFLIIAPLILGILAYSNRKFRDICVISSASAFGFLLGCPYSVFDLNNFLADAGYEAYHYRVRGHQGAQATPGIEQLKFFLSHFKNWINNIFHIKKIWNLSLMGTLICLILYIKNFLIIFSFPVLYLFYMSQQKVNFIRNMVCITPFVALSIGIALYYFYRILIASLNFFRRKKLFRSRINRDVIFIGWLLILLIFLRPIGAIKSAYQYKKTYKETRTKAVEYVRDNFPNAKIGISKELKIHPYDLDKVQNKVLFNTEKVSLINLYEKNFDYIISSNKYFYYNVQKRTKYSHNLEELERKFPEQNIIKAFGDGSVVIDFLSKEPRINIYKVNKAFLNAKYIKKIQ